MASIIVVDFMMIKRGQGDSSNECGMAMCLRKATALGRSSLPVDMEEARQYWHGGELEGGAVITCPGTQPNGAPPPVIE